MVNGFDLVYYLLVRNADLTSNRNLSEALVSQEVASKHLKGRALGKSFILIDGVKDTVADNFGMFFLVIEM